MFDRWLRRRLIALKEMQILVAQFFMDIHELSENGGLIIESVDSVVVRFSIDLIMKHHLSLNDALHLYTALRLREHIGTFSCSDTLLNVAARNEGLSVYDPEG